MPVARRLLRHALDEAGAEHLIDDAALATSELVTNALVHAGPVVTLTVWPSRHGVRVEVSDSSPHVPAERGQVVTSSTGRGLRLVAASSDRWGVAPHHAGKSVWFEIGTPRVGAAATTDEPAPVAVADPGEEPDLPVTLLGFPILMHWAWQEHASVLLREYLLHVCEDDPSVLDRHAEASAALSVLREQVPLPDLPEDPEALLDLALEPAVTAAAVSLRLPAPALGHFATLDALLRRATRAARESLFLSPPTQPEIAEMREWLCREVERQAGQGAAPTRWQPANQARATTVGNDDLKRRYPGVAVAGPEAVVTANSGGIIVAATPRAVEILGYGEPAELVGRRVLVVVPERYHQAHVAGTTLNATNGRDALLGVPLTVPMVRADGEEVPVELRVEPRLLVNGETVFEATLALSPPA